MQKKAKAMQKKMQAIKIQAESKDGKVVLFMNGAQDIEDIHIDESLLSPDRMDVISMGVREASKDFQKKLQKQLAKDMDMDDLKGMLS
jgi:DNA-binding protein YbaB